MWEGSKNIEWRKSMIKYAAWIQNQTFSDAFSIYQEISPSYSYSTIFHVCVLYIYFVYLLKEKGNLAHVSCFYVSWRGRYVYDEKSHEVIKIKWDFFCESFFFNFSIFSYDVKDFSQHKLFITSRLAESQIE